MIGTHFIIILLLKMKQLDFHKSTFNEICQYLHQYSTLDYPEFRKACWKYSRFRLRGLVYLIGKWEDSISYPDLWIEIYRAKLVSQDDLLDLDWRNDVRYCIDFYNGKWDKWCRCAFIMDWEYHEVDYTIIRWDDIKVLIWDIKNPVIEFNVSLNTKEASIPFLVINQFESRYYED